MMRIVEIPLLGQPLAGKTTVLMRARDALGGHLKAFEFVSESGHPCRLSALHIQSESAHGQLWCVRGTSSLPLLPAGSPAVFVFDSQEAVQDDQSVWFDAHAAQVDLSRSVSIVTKCDLPGVVQPSAAVPAALRERPFVAIAALDPGCVPDVQGLLLAHFDAFERVEGARPLQERAAMTVLGRP